MHPVNLIIFTKRDFGDNLYQKVAQQIQLLLESGNICTIYDADVKGGIISIEYANNNPIFGQPYPY